MILLYSGQSDMDMCYVSKKFLQSMKFPCIVLMIYVLVCFIDIYFVNKRLNDIPDFHTPIPFTYFIAEPHRVGCKSTIVKCCMCKHRSFRRACLSMQSRQKLHCSPIQALCQAETSALNKKQHGPCREKNFGVSIQV